MTPYRPLAPIELQEVYDLWRAGERIDSEAVGRLIATIAYLEDIADAVRHGKALMAGVDLRMRGPRFELVLPPKELEELVDAVKRTLRALDRADKRRGIGAREVAQ